MLNILDRSVFPPLKIAFVGGGINSAVGRAHFNAINVDGLYELVAGNFSRDISINEQSARFYGVTAQRTYQNHHDLLAHESHALDALVVLTPTSSHLAPITAAFAAGIPVISEKALGSNLDEIETISDLERQYGAFLSVTYNYTGYPALRELRALIRKGKIGKILHFTAEMPQEGFIRRTIDGSPLRPQEWRLRDGQIPTVYLDLAVHLHQIIHYLIDRKPRSVTAFQHSYGNFPEVVDYVNASALYSNDIHGNFYFGKSMLGYRNGLKIRIFGSDASAEWEQIRPEELRIAHADGRIEILDRSANAEVCSQARYSRFKAGHPAGYIEAFANLYVDIYHALMAFKAKKTWQSEEVFGSSVAKDGMNFLDAMARSAKTQSIVHLVTDEHRTS